MENIEDCALLYSNCNIEFVTHVDCHDNERLYYPVSWPGYWYRKNHRHAAKRIKRKEIAGKCTKTAGG